MKMTIDRLDHQMEMIPEWYNDVLTADEAMAKLYTAKSREDRSKWIEAIMVGIVRSHVPSIKSLMEAFQVSVGESQRDPHEATDDIRVTLSYEVRRSWREHFDEVLAIVEALNKGRTFLADETWYAKELCRKWTSAGYRIMASREYRAKGYVPAYASPERASSKR